MSDYVFCKECARCHDVTSDTSLSCPCARIEELEAEVERLKEMLSAAVHEAAEAK